MATAAKQSGLAKQSNLVTESKVLIGKHFNTAAEELPDIITFATGDEYLRRKLYPRQATFLKLIFLGLAPNGDELFTDYDRQVINEWVQSFTETGDNGIQTDIWRRVEICRSEGRKWFREVLAIMGRRGSKGYIGAIAGSYILWHYLKTGTGDPQSRYGVDRDKRLAALVFAGKKEQAKANQWRDLTSMILGAECFSEFISNSHGESLTIYAPQDRERLADLEERGIKTDMDLATFEIVPKESTVMAGRGPAGFMLMFDEMAHIVNSGANRSAEEVYEASTPALDQFGKDAWIYEPSSPWQKLGQFYENFERSLEVEENNEPVWPEMLMLQLTSWDIYVDWQMAHTLPMRPLFKSEVAQGITQPPMFPKFNNAIQQYDEQMKRLERANPETFAVERRSRWAAALNAYLNPDRIAAMFETFRGKTLNMQSQGALATIYRAHGDPSKSGANFGFAIAHLEEVEGSDLPHVVFDVIRAWSPGDFEHNNYEIDYRMVESELKGHMDGFMPAELTFDQFGSIQLIQNLRVHAAAKRYPKRVTVFERTATKQLNWITAETFKTALGLGLLHAPYYELAELELTFLQDLGNERVDHATSGPCQTKDVFDAMSVCVHSLVGDAIAALVGKAFSDFSVGAELPGGQAPFAEKMDPTEALSTFSASGGMGFLKDRPRGPRAIPGGYRPRPVRRRR